METLTELINWLSREEIQEILEAYGFAVYDDEAIEDLREALRVNIEDGTIDLDDIRGKTDKR
jgi:hypothetical protein